MTSKDFDELFSVSEVDLIYKARNDLNSRPQVTNAEDAEVIFRRAWDANKIDLLEQTKVLFLNRANKVLGIYNSSSGGITGTVMDFRLIFAAALKTNATSIILAHNHPSGNLTPSVSDKLLTQQFKDAGKLLNIQVLDHLILSGDRYYSMANQEEIITSWPNNTSNEREQEGTLKLG